MGLDLTVPCSAPPSLDALIVRLSDEGLACTVLMIDGALVHPQGPRPSVWREVRLRTPAGMATLSMRPGGVSVLVFGNADAALQAAQRRIADALAAMA
jgi:hypothetical protein